MKKTGKARKAAKHREAAKHHARQKHAREHRRERRHSRRPAVAYDVAGSEVSPEAQAALAFCRDHDMAPHAALQQLLDGASLRAGMSAHVVPSPAVRDELIRRLVPVVFPKEPVD